MDKISIFGAVRSAREEKDAAKKEYDRVKANIEIEIIEAIKKIEKKFEHEKETTKEEYDLKVNKYIDACSDLYDYGYFANDDIVPLLAIFMSYVEGERFVSCISGEAETNSIIAKASKVSEKEEISEEQLRRMYAMGDAIILSDGFTSCVELYNKNGEPKSYLGNYEYVRDFLEALVIFRAENNYRWHVMIPPVTYKFMAEYLASHQTLKITNRAKRDRMLSEENEEFRSECAKLELVQNK